MKTISQEELNEKIRLHELWLEGLDGERLYLNHFDLSCANLSYANLREANLSYVDLSYANLKDTNLSCATLNHSNLRHANLIHANLYHAYLCGANLEQANLMYANLSRVDFNITDLSYANLEQANLMYANLTKTDLKNANLSCAELTGVVLTEINGIKYVEGQRIISVQVDTSRNNNPINYWVDLDIVTTGCFQGTLQELKDMVEVEHKNNKFLLERYRRVIKFIEDEVEFDKKRKAKNE